MTSDESQDTVAENTPYTPTIDDILSPDFKRPENYRWFFLRVNYNRAEKLYNELKERKDGYLLWMPCQKNISYKDGKKIESLAPIFKSNIFLYGTFEQAHELTHRSKNGYPFVDFVFDHTNKNQFGRDNILTISFSEMKNFITAANVLHPWAHIVEPEMIHFREGGMVLVTDGSFKGVVGKVARVYGQTRVVVTIKGIVNYATAYISQKYLQPIEESDTTEEKSEAGNSLDNRLKRHEVKLGGFIPDENDHKRRRR